MSVPPKRTVIFLKNKIANLQDAIDECDTELSKWGRQFNRLGAKPHQEKIVAELLREREAFKHQLAEYQVELAELVQQANNPKLF